MSIDSTLVVSHCRDWFTSFVARRGHHQLIGQRSKISISVAIILLNAIYKEFYVY